MFCVALQTIVSNCLSALAEANENNGACEVRSKPYIAVFSRYPRAITYGAKRACAERALQQG